MKSIRGVFGGTFDPVHTGHVQLGRWLCDQGLFDSVYYLVNYLPAHSKQPSATGTHLRLALEDEDGLYADDREIRRQGISYTHDSLVEIRSELGAEPPLALIVGGDSLEGMMDWHHSSRFRDLTHLVVLERPGIETSQAALEAMGMATCPRLDSLTQSSSGSAWLAGQPTVEASSTQVRELLAAGSEAGSLVPPRVLDYIRRHRLYAAEH